MYEMAIGKNKFWAPILVQVLGLPLKKASDVDIYIPRFRDVFIVGGDPPMVCILTRTGGGNRAEYESDDDSPNNNDLRLIPGYVKDEDWKLDSTYAIFYYEIKDNDNAEAINTAFDDMALSGIKHHPTDKHYEFIRRYK